MMKRFLAFLLSAVLLAGCSSGQSAFDTLRKTGTAGREILKGAGAIASSLLTGENKDTAAEQEMTEIVIENPPEETGEIRIDLEREEAESSSEALPEETEAPSESYAGPPGSNDNIEVGAGPQQPESVTEPAPSEGLPPAPEPETEQTGPAEVPDDLHTGPGAITESTYRREADTPVYWEYCRISGEMVELKASAAENAQVYETSDPSYYLFDLPIWADGTDGREPAAAAGTEDGSLFFSLPLNSGAFDSRLYSKFVICRRIDGRYIPVSPETYVMNPEAAARYTRAYEEPLTKKGLLIEFTQVSDAFSLGVHSVILNIPFNQLVGEGIDFFCDGKSYSFDREVVETYDEIISTFSNKSMNVNIVLLNRWNDAAPDFFEPGIRKTDYADYYNFNVDTERGFELTKAAAVFLAERYSGSDPDHGRVQNWIIGNEVNNQRWNYLGAASLPYYAARYERVFRVFYNAIRSTCANDRVFFSLDNNWMHQADGSFRYNSREFLDCFADLVHKHGNIDWGLAYHPYSVPSTEPEFWDDHGTGLVNWSDDSPVVNFANLSVLTDHMQKEELLDREGRVRHIILSEQGFTSESLTRGSCEDLQAAAFAYAYYIVDSNPYIDTFILSRQIDAPSEVKDSLALGLWTTSSSEDVNIQPLKRKKIWTVFKNIDRQKSTLETTAFAKEILGIEKWSDVIPGFRWQWLENEE